MTRLYCILARDADTGVIFRRGPSKQVRLIGWNLKDHSFELGQWLKGRIYETHCDLSPDGKKLVYFAANQKPPMYTWTAVSNVPYLTALVLWQVTGTWGGGGLFETNAKLLVDRVFNLEKALIFHRP